MRLSNPAPFTAEPAPEPAEISLRGNHGEVLRIAAITPSIMRVAHLPEGHYRLDRTWSITAGEADVPLAGQRRDAMPKSAANAKTDVGAARAALDAGTLRAEVDFASGAVTWFAGPSSEAFAEDLPRRPYVYDQAGRAIYHYMRQGPHEHYYGFGEVTGPLDKRGQRIQLRNADAAGYAAEASAPLYKHIPFYITYIPERDLAYGLFYDNLAATTFDLGREANAGFGGFSRIYSAEDGDLDYYLIFGPSIEQVVEGYTWLTGRPALLPDYALGYLASTMNYTEAENAQEQLATFVEQCEEHRICCDLFHLSSGYTVSPEGRRFVFTWNRQRVPDPAQMMQTFHDAGIRAAANVKPHLLATHPKFPDVAARGGFITEPGTGQPALNAFWSGGMYDLEPGALLDFTNPHTFEWWKDQLKAELLSYGIDAVWNDNNEFELWDDDAVCAGFGAPFRIGLGGRGLGTLLMGRASFEALAEYGDHERPYVLTRAGVPGIQRYAQTWSGDNTTSWETLKWNQPMGLGLSLSGVPNTGHDIGGFFGPSPDPELFVRWCQLGAFFPRFTIHSWKPGSEPNSPWMHPEVLPLVRAAINLRYQLKPTLAALMREAHETGHPIMRPLVYHFSDDARARSESFDFMLGPDLLIAPIMAPGVRQRPVYLPKGKHSTGWVNFHTGEAFDGGAEVVAPAPIEHLPVFVRAGAVIALDPTITG